jgi:hypothetical protein
MDSSIERAAKRVAWASLALDQAADDLFRAGRRGAPVNGAGTNLEHEATRIEQLAVEVEALQAVAV